MMYRTGFFVFNHWFKKKVFNFYQGKISGNEELRSLFSEFSEIFLKLLFKRLISVLCVKVQQILQIISTQ